MRFINAKKILISASVSIFFIGLIYFFAPLNKRLSTMTNAHDKNLSVVSKDESHWFKGTVEEAFSVSKSKNTPLLLYWGAEWCPPCHELKDNVFSHPEFSELAKGFTSVYLDGDSESAQTWGEKYNLSGYPTVLLLKPGKDSFDELLRIGSELTFREFKELTQLALAKEVDWNELSEKAKMLSSGVNKVGFSETDLYFLSSFPEKVMSNLSLDKEEKVEFLLAILTNSSIELKKLNHASYLRLSNHAAGLVIKSGKSSLKEFLAGYLEETAFQSNESIWIARHFLSYNFQGFIENYNSIGEKFYEIANAWIEALDRVRENPLSGSGVKIWSLLPYSQFLALNLEESFKGRIKHPLLQKRKLIEKIFEIKGEANTKHQKGATASAAAYLLGEIKAFDEAERILLDEIKTSSTPWYYYRSLSSLYKKKGDLKGQLKWSKKASETVKGEATRLQWLSSEVETLVETSSGKEETAAVMLEFFKFAKETSACFEGRNVASHKRIKKAYDQYLPKKLQTQIDLEGFCAGFDAEASTLCKRIYL